MLSSVGSCRSGEDRTSPPRLHVLAHLGRALVAASALTCSLVVDTAGLEGGAEDAGAIADRDAPANLDADIDAGIDAGTFCERRATPKPDLCRDFDDDQPVDSLWDTRIPSLGVDAGVTRIDSDRPFSAPGSLLVTVPPFSKDAGSDYRDLSFFRRFSPVVSSAHVELSYRLNAGRGRVMVLGFSQAGRRIFFEIEENRAILVDVPSYQFFTFIVNRPVIGRWYRLVLDMSYATREFKVTVDGQDPFGSVPQLAPIDTPTGTFTMTLGLPAAFGGAEDSVSFDDVLLLLK